MENRDKAYYTPSIEEFHVGFEYELESMLIDTDVVEYSTHICSIKNKLEDLESMCKYHTVRVKYLDKEDIESLGFICCKTDKRVFRNKDGIIINTGWGSPIKNGITLAIVHPVFDESKMNIIHENYIFNGTIKNKSELKVLMNQIGINE